MYSSTLYKPTEYAINPLANNFNPYAALYTSRTRLSSTCETESSAGSTTGSSSGSSTNSSTSATFSSFPGTVQYGSAIAGTINVTPHLSSSTKYEGTNPYSTSYVAEGSTGSTGERDSSDGSDGRGEEESLGEREPLDGEVTDKERAAVERFFSGLKTQVYVCQSLANLYTRPNNTDSEWELCFTGIPVVLLDMGEAKSRNKRRIQIILAERGSSFMLWRDTIDNLTSYKVSGKAFHTMCLSSDHMTLIGISFDVAEAAEGMWQHIDKLVACPENISLSAPGKKKKKEKKEKPAPLPPKTHISQPCCFQHVTSVDIEDKSRYMSLQRYLSTNNMPTTRIVPPGQEEK